MSEDKKYTGQQFVEGKKATDVPPMPTDLAKDNLPPRQGIGEYAKVTMIGHYGAFCAQSQTLSFSNVSLNQARQERWDYFGACGAQMTCYDEDGNVVHEE